MKIKGNDYSFEFLIYEYNIIAIHRSQRGTTSKVSPVKSIHKDTLVMDTHYSVSRCLSSLVHIISI